GPIYMCYDAWLQEQPLEQDVPLPPGTAAKVPARMAADPEALKRVAEELVKAKRPVILAEFVGREPEGFHALEAFGFAADELGEDDRPFCLNKFLRYTFQSLGIGGHPGRNLRRGPRGKRNVLLEG